MSFRSIIAAGLVAAGFAAGAAPAMARDVHVMGLTIQQPEVAPQREVSATRSLGARYVVQDGRIVARPAARR